jgi:hypothetical protein
MGFGSGDVSFNSPKEPSLRDFVLSRSRFCEPARLREEVTECYFYSILIFLHLNDFIHLVLLPLVRVKHLQPPP